MGLYSNFPSDVTEIWIKPLFVSKKIDEPISFAEERRVFYVGFTRTKNNVYLLINENKKLGSEFINELYEIIEENKN